jgi:hypothetical protein
MHFLTVTPTRFGAYLRKLQEVLYCFVLYHIKMTEALTDSKITIFAESKLYNNSSGLNTSVY